MVTGPGFLASPRSPRRPAPPSVPLFRPLEANPETGLLPPRYQDAPSGNFFKKSFPINSGIFLHPRVMGPGAKIFISKIWLGGGTFGRRLLALCVGTLTYFLVRPISWLPGSHDDPQPFDLHLLFLSRIGSLFGLTKIRPTATEYSTTSAYCSLNLSLDIFPRLWDKRFIFLKPLLPSRKRSP